MAKSQAEQIAEMVGARPKPVAYAVRRIAGPSAYRGVHYPPGSWAVYTDRGRFLCVLDEFTFGRLYALDHGLSVEPIAGLAEGGTR